MPYTIIGGIGVMTLADNCQMNNPANVMTLNNQIMLCGNCTLTNYIANSTFATLSESDMYPYDDIYIPICVDDGSIRIAPLHISPLGELSLPFDYATATVYLNGIQFTSNSKWYTPEIGNVYNNGTSPLSES